MYVLRLCYNHPYAPDVYDEEDGTDVKQINLNVSEEAMAYGEVKKERKAMNGRKRETGWTER